MLIDKSYFVGEINIPRATVEEVEERIKFFIAKYEPALLQSILGYALYNAFLTSSTDQIYVDLRDGVEYTDRQGKTQKWKGLRVPATKQSLIANYVYYFWQRDALSQTSGIGEVKAKSENAATFTPQYKMLKAWNEMSAWIDELTDFLDASAGTYPLWDKQKTCGVREHFRPVNQFGI